MKRLKQWLLRRFTDYYKIQRKNQELLYDMRIIVENDDSSIERFSVLFKWGNTFHMEDFIWNVGSSNPDEVGKGFMSRMEKDIDMGCEKLPIIRTRDQAIQELSKIHKRQMKNNPKP